MELPNPIEGEEGRSDEDIAADGIAASNLNLDRMRLKPITPRDLQKPFPPFEAHHSQAMDVAGVFVQSLTPLLLAARCSTTYARYGI